jgi:hypothetical protein
VIIPLFDHRQMTGFLDSKGEKLNLKTVSIQLIPPQAVWEKRCKKMTNLSTKTKKSTTLQIRLVRPLK